MDLTDLTADELDFLVKKTKAEYKRYVEIPGLVKSREDRVKALQKQLADGDIDESQYQSAIDSDPDPLAIEGLDGISLDEDPTELDMRKKRVDGPGRVRR